MAFALQIGIITIITASLVLQDLQPANLTEGPATCLLGIAIAQVLIFLSATHVVRQTLAERRSHGFTDEEIGKRLDVRLTRHRSIWLVSVFLILVFFQWPQTSVALSPNRLVARMIVLGPVTLPLLMGWAIFYSIESELNAKLKQQSRAAFVLDQARLILLLPLTAILFVVVWQDLVEILSTDFAGDGWVTLIRVTPLALIALAFPIFLRLAWKTEQLKPGKLRNQLEQCCEDLGFVKRDLLVWKTDNRMRNAAISGIVPKWRFILLSDRLLKDLSIQQVESIFLHEVGHARHRHHLKLIGVSVLTICSSVGTLAANHSSESLEWVGSLVGFGGLILAIVLIGRLARLFEHQADLFAAKRCDDFPVEYLRAIASISGGAPDRRSWMHPSFDQRCEFLFRGENAGKRWLHAQLLITVTAASTLVVSLVLFGICS